MREFGKFFQPDVDVQSGPSFPSGPDRGQLFYHTGRGLLYAWTWLDAINTYKWLTVDEYNVDFSVWLGSPGSATITTTTANKLMAVVPYTKTYEFWIDTFTWSTFVATTNNSTNNWRFDLIRSFSGNTETTISQPSTSADSINLWTPHTTTVNALLPSLTDYLTITIVRVLFPGSLQFVGASVSGRLVG